MGGKERRRKGGREIASDRQGEKEIGRGEGGEGEREGERREIGRKRRR